MRPRARSRTALITFVGAVTYLVVSARVRPGREDPSVVQPRTPTDAADPESATTDPAAART